MDTNLLDSSKIESKLETKNASKYHALYIVQFFTGNNKYICSSNITKLINKKIEERLDSPMGMSLVASLNVATDPETILHQYKHLEINSWEDILNLYCVLAIVSEMVSRKDIKYIELLDNLIDLCSSQKISDWIVKNGGWEGFLKNYPNLSTNYKKFLLGAGIVTGIIGFSFYLFKK